MPGYRLGCIFRALPQFYTEGQDLALLVFFRPQGFQPNDRGLAVVQHRLPMGFADDLEIHGRYRERCAALSFLAGDAIISSHSHGLRTASFGTSPGTCPALRTLNQSGRARRARNLAW